MIVDNDHPLPRDAGAWGALVATTERAAGLVSDAMPLQVLRQGESIGEGGYAAILEAAGLGDALHVELAALRSRCSRHIRVLDDLIAKVPERAPRPMLGRRAPSDPAPHDSL